MTQHIEPGPAQRPGKGRLFLEGGVLVMLMATLWLAQRPIKGIVHDARLYMAQALYRLDTPGLENDLFFQFGSQDSFSAFSPIFAPAVALWGPGTAHMVFALAGQTLWLLALWVLARALFGRGWLSMASVGAAVVMVPNYGWGVLSYGEVFVTPRLFAEAMTLLALAAALRGRRGLGFALMLGAGMLHPLMALPGLVVLALLSLPVNRWTLGATGLAAAGGVVMAFAGIEPFARLLQSYDPAWLDIMRDRVRYVFVSDWAWRAPSLAMLPMVVLLVTLDATDTRHARLAGITLGVAVAMTLASWIGADLMHNVLIMNLQLWRALWLVSLLGNLFVIQAILHLPLGQRARLFLGLAAGASVVAFWIGFPPVSAALMALAALAARLLEQRHGDALPMPYRVGLDLLVLLAAIGLVLIGVWNLMHTDTSADLVAKTLRLSAIFGAGILLLSRKAIAPLGLPGRAAVAALCCGAMIAVADSRSPMRKYIEHGPPPDPALLAHIQDKSVYWEANPELMWFKLRQPSYYSCAQGAGAMFFRGTALAYQQRSTALSLLNTADFSPTPGTSRLCFAKPNPTAMGPTRVSQLARACTALPGLDLIVLRNGIDGMPGTRWRAPVTRTSVSPPHTPQEKDVQDPYVFHIYACQDLRNALSKASLEAEQNL